MPRVSVIIPVYNVEKYLRKALDSVVNQTLSDIEIICVDDCSTDNSLQILKEYAQKDNRIKIIEQKVNQGQGVARNLALDCSKGEYIMFLDPDDWYELNACELAYNQITKNQNQMVLFFYKRHNEETGITKVGNREKRYAEFLSVSNLDINKAKDFEINDFYTWSQIYQKAFLSKYNIRFGICRMFEDQEFMGQAYIYANNISILNAYLYNYRIRRTSTTYTEPYSYKVLLNISKELFNILLKQDSTKKLMGTFISHRLRSIYYWQTFYKKYGIKIKLDYYRKMREFFIYVNKNINIDDYKEYIGLKNYNKFEKILDENTLYYCVKTIVQNIFSIRNEYQKEIKHKVITILGIKIKIKCKDMPETRTHVERERERERERVIRLTAYRRVELAKAA